MYNESILVFVNFCTKLLFHLAAIAVGLQESQYQGTEGDELKLCIEATAGYIGRDFILSFETTDQTASVNGTVVEAAYYP